MSLVVVTGGTGFVGREVVRCLHSAGADVLRVERADQWSSPPRYHQFDLARPETLLPDDLAGQSFTLIHLAWSTARSGSYQECADHVSWLAGLLDYWGSRGLERIIAPGSAEEYGKRAGCLLEEDPPGEPLTAYGWSKRATLELLRNWSATFSTSVVWLRPFLIYGPGQAGNMVLPYALRQALAGEPVDLSDGVQQRDFVHVHDVAEAFLAALNLQEQGTHVINVGSGKPTRLRDVLEDLADALHARHLFHFGARPRRKGEPLLQFADTTRAHDMLGWRARIGWRDGLQTMIDDARDGLRRSA